MEDHPDKCVAGFLVGFTISVFLWMKYGRFYGKVDKKVRFSTARKKLEDIQHQKKHIENSIFLRMILKAGWMCLPKNLNSLTLQHPR